MRSFMNDEEYFNFVRPYADAMQMLLTRLMCLTTTFTVSQTAVRFITSRTGSRRKRA